MKKRKIKSGGHSGFWLSFFVNLLLRIEWLVLAALALAAFFVFHLTIAVFVIFFVVWILVSLGVTLLLGWASDSAAKPGPEKKNVNPYSKTEFDYIHFDK